MRELTAKSVRVGENIVCELHRRIVTRSQPEIAGISSFHARRIAGSPVIFPNPVKIPALMEILGDWLEQANTRHRV